MLNTTDAVPPPNRHPKTPAWGIMLVLFGLLAIAYSVVIPYGEPPDEPAHAAYIWYLLEEHELPVLSFDVDENITNEGHHPPLYYAITAALTTWAPYDTYPITENPYLPIGEVDSSNVLQFLHPASEQFPWEDHILAVHAGRLVSVTMAILSVWLTYQSARLIVPESPAVAFLAAGIHAFIPQFVFISASINNDNLAILIGSLLIWQMIRIFKQSNWRRWLVLGVLLGLGLLSKLNLIAMFPAAGCLLLYTSYMQIRELPDNGTRVKYGIRDFVVKGLLVGVPVLALTGWWLYRNIILYGDPLAWDIRMAIFAEFERKLPLSFSYVIDFLWQQFRSYWGPSTWGRPLLSDTLYWILLIFAVLAGLSTLRLIVDLIKKRDTKHAAVMLLLITAGTMLAANWWQARHRDTVAAQGRLLFPALSAITILVAWGILYVFHKRRHLWAIILTAALGVLSLGILLLRLVPLYTPPLVDTIPSTATAVNVEFGPWELLAWESDDPNAGEDWQVTLYWQAWRELTDEESTMEPYQFIHILDEHYDTLVKWDGAPIQGHFPPQVWEPGIIVKDTVTLTIPEMRHDHLAWLGTGFYTKDEGYLSPIETAEIPVQSLANTILLGPMMVRTTINPGTTPSSIEFITLGDDAVQLRDYQLIIQNDLAALTLHWEALNSIPEDYTVFVHVDAGEALVTQTDTPPCNGTCPTSLWQAGDTWRDTHLFSLPTDYTGDSPLTLSIGLYNPTDGTRMPAYTPQRQRYLNDIIPLCTFNAQMTDCSPTQ